MIHDFKGLGMCCTMMDSAHMGDIICQIGRDVWKFNFLGTCQNDRCGAGPMLKKAKSEMKVGTYETRFFQHRMKNLVFALWADNNIVKTLSNFHSPELLEAGHGVL